MHGSHDLVAIGASAGGVSALQVVVAALPEDLAAAVLIVQHLEPTHASVLSRVLGRGAAIPVHAAVDGEDILCARVYVAVPDHHLLVTDGRIALTSTPRMRFARPCIDTTFESVADHYAARAVGVVLTGSGSDGSRGIRAISAAGGATIAQRPDDAAYPAMPASAYATGCVDVMLPLREIAPAIVRLVVGEDPQPVAKNRG